MKEFEIGFAQMIFELMYWTRGYKCQRFINSFGRYGLDFTETALKGLNLIFCYNDMVSFAPYLENNRKGISITIAKFRVIRFCQQNFSIIDKQFRRLQWEFHKYHKYRTVLLWYLFIDLISCIQSWDVINLIDNKNEITL